MNCPICNVPLLLADKNAIEIDYCPKCRGIWLDRGELEKIIERTHSSYTEPAYYQHHDDKSFGHHDRHDSHYSSQGYPQHRKKGFLSDIFDF